MNSILLATDFVAALFIVVILIGLYEIPGEALKATRHFRRCMWIVLIGLNIECLAQYLDGKQNLSFLLLILNYAGYVLLDLLTIIYSYYLIYLVEENAKRFIEIQAKGITCLLSLDICFLTIGVITGKLFTITDGYYVEELRNYMIEVGRNTRRIISKLTLEQIKSMAPEEWVMRILEEGRRYNRFSFCML